jgi:hypothetical protein
MNDALINEAIAILQTMNMEDCAAEIQKLRNELERVRGIAGRRLDRIAQLQSDLTYEKGISTQQRSLAGQLALELAQLEDDPRRLEDSDDAEIEASLERIRDLEI